jgi:hypothetical protein
MKTVLPGHKHGGHSHFEQGGFDQAFDSLLLKASEISSNDK